MRRYGIGERVFDEGTPALQEALAAARDRRSRPTCLCRDPGVPMYIALVDGQFLVKRMPLTGGDHAPACESYEPPYELTGLGPLIGNAIQFDEAKGTITLKLDFSLTKTGSRGSPASVAESSKTVRNETRKLSLRALLHFLWHEGELTEWTSAWQGKRGWGKVRSSLTQAAQNMSVRAGSISQILFVPEVFRADDKAGIASRRAAAFAPLHATGSGPRKLMVLIGEVKEFAPLRGGQKISIRHMPDFPFMLEDSAWRRLQARYQAVLELWKANDASHLVMIATAGISGAGLATIEEIALMVVTENWIPFESTYEERLLERLGSMRRKSIKGLRFNLAQDQPIACATLPDPAPVPLVLYIVPPGADEAYEKTLSELIEARPEMTPWVWRPAQGDMPDLPRG